MIKLLTVLALLSPAVDGGVRIGGGLLHKHPILVSHPWLAIDSDTARIALVAPLNIDLDAGELRARDWDEVGDYGRIIHDFRWGKWLRGGSISNRTLGNGTILRRYHNGVDRDNARLGIEIHLDKDDGPKWAPNHMEFLVDQVLAAPVMGGAVGRHWKDGHILLTSAADFAAPARHRSELDEQGRPRADRILRWAYGLSLHWRPFEKGKRFNVSVLTDVNSLGPDHWGGHGGFAVNYDDQRLWRIDLRVGAMALGAGYTWSLFDTGYLIDRWRGIDAELQASEAAMGGQGSLQINYADALIVGFEYADCDQGGRRDFGSWLRLPLKRITVESYWKVRRFDGMADVFDAQQFMAALSLRAKLTSPLHAELVVARDWFAEEPSGAYKPNTSALFMVEASWESPR